MTNKIDVPLPPPGESRRITLEALHALLKMRRNAPAHRDAIREYENIQKEIRRIERISPDFDLIKAARRVLEERGTWIALKELGRLLDEMDVQSQSTRNLKVIGRGERRSLSNAERLERTLLQSVNHGRFLGYKKSEYAEEVTYIGLTDFSFPAGVRRIEPKGRTPRKKK